jgi:methionyl-tRNA synthetase
MTETPIRYVTTAIPYVNAAPHLGHALELVQADVLARHARLRRRPTRFLTGTDDNALKNVTAARTAGLDVQVFVDQNAKRFEALREPLALSFDDFIRTSIDARHREGVERLWNQCSAAGDFYRRRYEGLYCDGCEQFCGPDELLEGRCPEHGIEPQSVAEENWFFRLSRYRDQILQLLESGTVRVLPEVRRNEVLSFVRAGLEDFSVSRPASRASGWGLPVPGDPDQIIYVWWDALTNYVTALGYGTDHPDFERWWRDSQERIHVIGKGIVRFHAVYWLALLLSAELPTPTHIFVHEYLTVDGAKLSKSLGNAVDPTELVEQYGVDALRWWLVSEVARVSDTDFTVERLRARYHQDLANGLGNLASRTLGLVHKFRLGRVPRAQDHEAVDALLAACAELPNLIDDALEQFDFRAATAAVTAIVDDANRLIASERPWELAKSEQTGTPGAKERLDAVLGCLLTACRSVAHELQPFLPAGAHRLQQQLLDGPTVGVAIPSFPRLE